MEEIVIVGAARTPIGSFGKAFAGVPAAELGIAAARAAMERAGIRPGDLDAATIGTVGQFGRDAYIARAVSLGAGLPVEAPALAVNRLCGSGLQAIISAAGAIRIGDAQAVLAVGTENMSRYPYFSFGARWGSRLGDSELVDGLLVALSDPFTDSHMGTTAETVAGRWTVSREDQDAFALVSQQRAAAAIAAGRFADEIVPVSVPGKGGQARVVDADEHPRPGATAEALAALKPAFREGGSVTAGNSSGIADGAAAVIVATPARAAALGLQARARLVAHAVVGVPPEIMGIGPIPAVRKVLKRAGLTLDEIDLIELNEAFAAQAVACIRELGMDPERVNVNGGAIALGHPIGATGCIMTVKLIGEMERRGSRYGLVTACIGGGQGIAAIFERVSG
ncbi:MAG: acetyl-CoA acetyltransferase [Chloroflexi bacterium RBG_16_69_14]|nr:MAG: acetyl-CoA acetyltransferase [Chloroflexi bacterium RBG_16_69_14]